MKEYYKIKEISRLYSLSEDALRYYEKEGLLKPVRGDNGYRLYSIGDIYRLNIIRDLRSLDFSVAQIKNYLDFQSVDNTLELLQDEILIIREKAENLIKAGEVISSRMERLKSIKETETGVFKLVNLPQRKCLKMTADIKKDEEADFAIKKLHKKYESMLPELSDQDFGAMPVMESLESLEKNNGYASYSSVFFILDKDAEKYDFIFKEGMYLSCFYKGDYIKTPPIIIAMQKFIKENNLKPVGNPIELCHIDNRHTVKEEEYLTEIQIPVEKL